MIQEENSPWEREDIFLLDNCEWLILWKRKAALGLGWKSTLWDQGRVLSKPPARKQRTGNRISFFQCPEQSWQEVWQDKGPPFHISSGKSTQCSNWRYVGRGESWERYHINILFLRIIIWPQSSIESQEGQIVECCFLWDANTEELHSHPYLPPLYIVALSY